MTLYHPYRHYHHHDDAATAKVHYRTCNVWIAMKEYCDNVMVTYMEEYCDTGRLL
jgi:hypothetical protein